MTWENENVSELERTLSARRGAPVSFVLPKDEVETKLIAMAVSNAREDARRTEQHQNEDILSLLQKALKLPRLPRRIECVDVSHTQGQQTRVGMIVYQDGVPSRHDYRVYAMPDSKDDYATLSNWIPLRIKSGPPFPDLLLIDGGLGQLACVERALTDLDKKELFPCAGIAKARKEDGQPDRRAGNVNDKIFLPNRSNPLPLRAGSAELLFLQQIRNTAHHFAIQRHRAARQKTALSGDLMCLPGIGPSTARLLWDKFGTLAAMRAASCEELAELSGVGKKRALKLLNALKNLPVR